MDINVPLIQRKKEEVMNEARGMSMKDNLISELSGRYGDDKTDKLVRYMQRISGY